MANLVAMAEVYRWKSEGWANRRATSLGTRPWLPWLRPRTLLGLLHDPSRFKRAAFTCRAMPRRAVPRCGVPRNVFYVPLEFPALHSSPFTYFAIQRSSGNRSNSAISAIFPLSSSPNSIFFSLSSFIPSRSIFLSLFLSLFLVELLLFPPTPELPVSCT